MILGLIDEAVTAGAREWKACEVIGLDPRTPQRWRAKDIGDDDRAGPKRSPANKLSSKERKSTTYSRRSGRILSGRVRNWQGTHGL